MSSSRSEHLVVLNNVTRFTSKSQESEATVVCNDDDELAHVASLSSLSSLSLVSSVSSLDCFVIPSVQSGVSSGAMAVRANTEDKVAILMVVSLFDCFVLSLNLNEFSVSASDSNSRSSAS